MNRVTAAVASPSWSTASRSTTSRYSSNLDWSWPQSASPTSLNLGLQVHFQTRSITSSKCISEFNLISASKCISESLDLGLQMYCQTRSITASKCISELTDLGLQIHLQTRLITASMCISELLDLGLQMHLQTRSITASKCISEFNSISASKWISKLTRSRPPCTSPSSNNHGLQVRL